MMISIRETIVIIPMINITVQTKLDSKEKLSSQKLFFHKSTAVAINRPIFYQYASQRLELYFLDRFSWCSLLRRQQINPIKVIRARPKETFWVDLAQKVYFG